MRAFLLSASTMDGARPGGVSEARLHIAAASGSGRRRFEARLCRDGYPVPTTLKWLTQT
jgi:hypothetical protein